jgi:hypothetical protein
VSVDAQFEQIDAEIETLHDELESCRRAILGSRAAIWLGAATILLGLLLVRQLRTPTILFSALTAVIGGTVWFGASRSTREDIERRLADLESRKATLFDAVAARNGWRDMTTTIH